MAAVPADGNHAAPDTPALTATTQHTPAQHAHTAAERGRHAAAAGHDSQPQQQPAHHAATTRDVDAEASEAEAGMLRAAMVARAAVTASLPRPFELLRLALKRPSISFFRPKPLKGASLNKEELKRHGARGAVQRAAPLIAANTVAGMVLFKTHHWVAATLEERLGVGRHAGTAACAGAVGGIAHALVLAPLQKLLQRSPVPPLRTALPVALARDALGFAGFFAGWSGVQDLLREPCASSQPLELCAAVVAGGVAGGAYQFLAHPFEGMGSLREAGLALSVGGRLARTARAAARSSRPAMLVGAGTFFIVEVLRGGLDAWAGGGGEGGVAPLLVERGVGGDSGTAGKEVEESRPKSNAA
jgi:hypothetical protein